jgi:transcriptional regulator with XRE-family HTH domain
LKGSELAALRDRLQLSAADLAAEIGTSPNSVAHVEMRKAVSVSTASRYVAAAFNLARGDISKRGRLAAELTTSAAILAAAAARLTPTP